MRVALPLSLLLCFAQQMPPRDPKPTPREGAPGAVIAGRVVDAETESPIPGAVVTISRLRVSERSRQVEADETGAYRVPGLPAGDYRIVATPPDYKPTHISRTLNVVPGASQMRPSLQLKAREIRDDVVIRLDRALAIEGRVIDELGQPMAGMRVNAERTDRPGSSGMMHYSDDRGFFRVFGLTAGSYRVCALPGSLLDLRMSRGTSGDLVERPYVRTCFPSAPTGGGQRIALKTGAAPPHLVIAMQRVTGYVVSGRIMSESGRQNLSVSLQHLDNLSGGGQPLQPQVADGAFVVRGVPPGTYAVRATATPPRVDPYTEPDLERATAIIQVDAGDISNLELMTTKGATIVGRIVPETPLPRGTKPGVTRAGTYSRIPMMMGWAPVPLKADLTFELRNMFDPLLFDVIGLPKGWIVMSVRYRGTEILDTLTTLSSTRDPSELEIVVSPRSAQLHIRPVDAEGRLMEVARVAMIRATGDRVTVPPVFDAEPPADGSIAMAPVRPGEYAVLVLRADAPMASSTEYAALVRRLGTRIALAAGEQKTVNVVVTSLPEDR